jgi:hypothetical protein
MLPRSVPECTCAWEQFFQVLMSCPGTRDGLVTRAVCLRKTAWQPALTRPEHGHWFVSSCWNGARPRHDDRDPRMGTPRAGLSRDECGFRVLSNAWPSPRALEPSNPCEPMRPMRPHATHRLARTRALCARPRWASTGGAEYSRWQGLRNWHMGSRSHLSESRWSRDAQARPRSCGRPASPKNLPRGLVLGSWHQQSRRIRPATTRCLPAVDRRHSSCATPAGCESSTT